MTWLADLTSFAESFVQNHTYLGAYLVLTACGFGVPLPEEVSIVGMGILVSQEQVRFDLAFVVCFLGVLSGDVVPYTVGRLWGDRAFENRWVRRVVNKRRLERLERRFREHL
ncbi:MAG: hypothetical protein R3F34_21020, partial [Planctomycetota bacterium]